VPACWIACYLAPPLLTEPDFCSAVPADELAWLLFEPGTTVCPVAPGVVLFMAEPLRLPVGCGALTSPVCIPDMGLLSAVPGDAVLDLLLPILAVGLLLCATAAAIGDAIKVAANKIGYDFGSISKPFCMSR
jgi:hypothetical protein